jgi:hypothetical protein
MSERRDERLIGELARDLAPVQPVDRLRAVVLRVLAAGALACAVAMVAVGVRPDLMERLREPGAYLAVLLGHAAVAGGAVVAGLASSRPDRGAVVRTGTLVLGAGAVLAVAACLGRWAAAANPGLAFHGTTPLWGDAGCLLRGSVYALFPGLVALVLALRGASMRPWRTAALVGAAASGVGALAVHLGCQSDAVRHVLVSHVLAPGFGALATLPAASILGRTLSRR